MRGRIIFPFSAMVGLDKLKLALLINAINPKIGGLLIRGPKGTGKTTAVRALIDILPKITVVKDCQFNCDAHDFSSLCQKCSERRNRGEELPTEEREMAVVNLPLGATEDRVVGSLDVEKVIKMGIEALEPGILAQANQNILYVDEINLLPDHIADDLLDAAATGWNVVEREGISASHPSRFVFIGTMNPEEGELRPQLLDRFSLSVGVEKINSARDRIEVVKKNIEFEKDSVAFREKYKPREEELAQRIVRARDILPNVKMPESLLEAISLACLELKVDGLRPDIVIAKAASTLAAFENRKTVTLVDVLLAAELALGHRTREGGFLEPATPEEIKEVLKKKSNESKYFDEDMSRAKPPEGTEDNEKDLEDQEGLERKRPSFATKKGADLSKTDPFKGTVAKRDSIFSRALARLMFILEGKPEKPAEESAASRGGEPVSGGERDQIFEEPEPRSDTGGIPTVDAALMEPDVTKGAPMIGKMEKSVLPPSKLSFKVKRRVRGVTSSAAGKRAEAVTTLNRGRAYGWRYPTGRPQDIHLPATIRVAARRQKHRERPIGAALKIALEDVREKSRLYRAPMTIVFVIDLSGSMAFSVDEAKQAILKLHNDAYRGRDKVGIVALKGTGAVVVQHPITNLKVVASKLSTLAISGYTPLAAGMLKALEVLRETKRRDMATVPVIAIITDGCANVPLNRSLEAEEVRIFDKVRIDDGKYDYMATNDALAVSKMIRKAGIYTVVVNTNPYLYGRNTYGFWVTRQIAELTNGSHHELGNLRGRLLAKKMFEDLSEDRRKITHDASLSSRFKI
ncbi:MAG: VWA domain-containing protein [Candidatus Hadarchaeota archaeon]